MAWISVYRDAYDSFTSFLRLFGVISLEPFYQHKCEGGGGMAGAWVTASTAPPPHPGLRPRFFSRCCKHSPYKSL